MTHKQKNLIFIGLILALVLFYIVSGGSMGISLDFGEEALMLSASDYDWAIPYDEIQSLELTDLPDTGTLIGGIDRRTLQCGTWKNEVWGEYTRCTVPGISRCILLTMTDGSIFVLNYESDDSTAALHEMFTQLLKSKGLPAEATLS